MNEETIRRNIRLIFNKLVSNDQARSVIDAAQRNIPSILRGGKLNGKVTIMLPGPNLMNLKNSWHSGLSRLSASLLNRRQFRFERAGYVNEEKNRWLVLTYRGRQLETELLMIKNDLQ